MLLAETKASNIIRQQQRNVHAKLERKQFTTYLHTSIIMGSTSFLMNKKTDE
jgi:hypothetical protein